MKVIEWLGDKVSIHDQARLPHEEVYVELNDDRSIASAIVELKIRGAPAIGVVSSYGIALSALKIETKSRKEFLKEFQKIVSTITTTRPTARNLFWAVDRMRTVVVAGQDIEQIKKALVDEAGKIHAEEIEADEELSQQGAELIWDNSTILTHCNTGALATAGYGTALGVIKKAEEQGKNIKVLATETRPLLQGARLTIWELKQTNIPHTLITDSMAGYFMNRGQVDCVIVGADRIAANGDTANKIGTYPLAVMARENGIPFYVAAPTTTLDMTIDKGIDIPIEERSPEEVTHVQGVAIAPEGTQAQNPAFDVTYHQYITAIITENGIVREPYEKELRGVTKK
jgi:methylthioribose-1-phosphate isomerase